MLMIPIRAEKDTSSTDNCSVMMGERWTRLEKTVARGETTCGKIER